MIKSNKFDLESFLVDYPHLRDCDRKLVASIWRWEISERLGLDFDSMTAFDILLLFSEGKLGNPTSIRRNRAKLQEHNPALRGKTWEARKAHSKVVKEEIKNWNK
tara:strand:- start:2325 stop:2639 length:315 start_codon:yes stop_codon:yes gene_type:complete